MPSIEPYRDRRLPERFLRWVETLRLKIRTIPSFTKGDGSPEGVITGTLGDRYYNRTGSGDTVLYVKTTATGNTGWKTYGELALAGLPLTAFGDLRTAELSPIFQGSFEYTVDNTRITTNVVTGTGTVTQASGMAVVGSGAVAGGDALLKSKQHARYRAGLGGLNRFTTRFTAGVAGTEQYIGLADERGATAAFKNGYMVGFDGVTFGFHRFANDVVDSIAQSAWADPMDGTGASGITLDLTKINVFAIEYQYLGGGQICLLVENPDTGKFVLAHRIGYANQNTDPSTHNPNFHHTMFVDNNAVANDVVVRSSSYAYFIEGKTSLIELHQPQFPSGHITKTTITAEVPIFSIRNKPAYQGKTNFIDLLLEHLAGSIEASSANNLGQLKLVRNGALTAAAFADINTSDSVVELDTAATAIVGGDELFNIPLAGKNDRAHEDVAPLRFIINPGDIYTITGQSAATATINASMLWRELF